jgi:hypothetical protein
MILSADGDNRMNFKEEFRTVDLILGSGARTRGVDAFVLSLIKLESMRQSKAMVDNESGG